MTIKAPLIHEIAERTWFIDEFGTNAMYILEGSERSLVIDIGTGYCDFPALIEKITDKPYDVAVTHAHPDHVGMMHQFDRIYIHRLELDGETVPTEERKKYSELLKDNQVGENFARFVGPVTVEGYQFKIARQHVGYWDAWEILEEDIVQGDKDTELVFIDEGYVFDLGDRKVSTVFLPGHTKGHLIFIDDMTRIAFTGDAVNHNNGSRYHAASTHIRYIQHFLEGYGKTYDRIFNGHTSYGGTFSSMSEPIAVVYNLIEAYRAYLRGEAEIVTKPSHIDPSRSVTQVVYGTDAPNSRLSKNPMVTPNVPPKMWEDGEEHIIP